MKRLSTGQAILSGWLLCGVLDITAACVQSWIQAGRTPWYVLKGLTMHFTVALTWTLIFFALSRRVAALRTAPWWIVGPIYGVIVFCVMNYATLPALSWLRSLHLHTPPRWPGTMTSVQLWIHMACVGTPIVWGVQRAG